MPQYLSVFRAARLVGITRSALQKRIHDGDLTTFEGQVALDDLLNLYPAAPLDDDSEYKRVQKIKSQAFAKRVRERILPDAEVLADRISELARKLATAQSELAWQQHLSEEIRQRLNELRENPTSTAVRGMINWLEQALAIPDPDDESRQDLLVQDTMLRVMAAHIKIQPSNHEYWLEGNENILDAGVKSGLALNYGCTGGNCGLCKARLISGEVKPIRHHDYVFSEAEKNMNYILMCSCTAVSDLVLEALEAADETDIPYQEIITRVKSVDLSNPEILLLHLQTPRSQRLRFLAGQSVVLSLGNGMQAEYPIASCPCDDRNIIFHLSRKDTRPIVKQLADTVTKGDEIILTGPHGDFLFRDESHNTPVFVAFETGFAPIKSLIEHAMALETANEIELYWAVDDSQALYANNLCRSWDDALEEFSYHPLVAEDPLARIRKNHNKLEDLDIYLAGPETSVRQTAQQLLDAGLPEQQLVHVAL